MPTTIPTMKGNFGTTEYFLTTMNIGEFLRSVRFPQELPDWKDNTIEERYQREINLTRIRNEIAPYFANDPDRFSGALVLAVVNHEDMVFEELWNIAGSGRSSVPQLYQSAATNIGFLTLQGSEILVPLDGQHRAKAFKYAVEGVDEKNRTIRGSANTELAKDQVPVILVRFDGPKARYIFNKLNRYAKPTVKADNLITDDDDAIAVLTRELIHPTEGILPPRLVRLRGNTLTGNAFEFTTLGTLYDATAALIKGLKLQGYGSPKQMNEAQRKTVLPVLSERWEMLLEGIDLWRDALSDATEGGDRKRIQIREQTLLGKPAGQAALIQAFLMMRDRCTGISEKELCERLNRIPWGVKEPMWINVLMHSSGRVIAGRGTNRAAQFIAHLGGAPLSDEETSALLEGIHGEGWEEQKLPDPV